MKIDRSGYALLLDPQLNKGTAFSQAERDAFGLNGLLPPHVATLDEQVERRLAAFHAIEGDLERYIFLRDTQDSDETLFQALLVGNVEEMLPIVYTPTVGEGCQQFSHIWRKPRGLFLSPPHQDRLAEILNQPRFDDVDAIVTTDGERILGLGDQGAGGMGIPIGKLALYSACGGLDPRRALPIMLDVGTNNKALLNDPLYIGWRHERVTGDAYDAFIEAFVAAVRDRWPHVLLQWEDFSGANAARLLERYRDKLCTFNDDIQGTAAVVGGAVFSALAASGQRLGDQTVAIMGAGSAGLGVADLLTLAMREEGLSEKDARGRFWVLDSHGLVTDRRGEFKPGVKRYAQPGDRVANWDVANRDQVQLEDVLRNAKPTMLIGVTGKAGTFTEAALREMARHVERPLVFPLSNPTANSEAKPSDIMAWTEGRAVIGTGSPFPPIKLDGQSRRIDQVNNAYVFPGIGLGVLAARARHVSDAMFLAAARALADMSPSRRDSKEPLLPPVGSLREVAKKVALAVARQAHREGLAQGFDPSAGEDFIRARMWRPSYPAYERSRA